MTLNISIKWNGNKYNDIPLDTSQPALVFKTQIYTLTGVEPSRQKIMVKGGVLKDDAYLNSFGFKNGQVLMMMGTAGELPKAPETPTLFMEDMTDAEITKALQVPAGLSNLGNTCYLNATLQCLRAIPELQFVLDKMPRNMGMDSRVNTVTALGSLFRELNNAGDALPPLVFLQLFRTLYPQFSEQDRGGYLQQDAEEAWGQIIHTLDSIPGLTEDSELNSVKHFVEQFMTVETRVSVQCDEAPQEEPNLVFETFNKLRVNIGSGVSTYMVSDIEAGLVEKIEKTSPSLGRLSMYTKTSKISRLPEYLTINFVRFQWKPQERVKAKILKKVKFPFDLDMTPFCTPELTSKLVIAKNRLKEIDELKSSFAKKRKIDLNANATPEQGDSRVVEQYDQRKLGQEIGVDSSLLSDVGANISGQYDLVAVLTHVGRTADSGHYIGWVKQQNGKGWWKFDDDKVSPCKDEDVTKLEGGGDWHSAYICLYKAKKLEPLPKE